MKSGDFTIDSKMAYRYNKCAHRFDDNYNGLQEQIKNIKEKRIIAQKAASLLYEVACATGVISLKFESVTTFVTPFSCK